MNKNKLLLAITIIITSILIHFGVAEVHALTSITSNIYKGSTTIKEAPTDSNGYPQEVDGLYASISFTYSPSIPNISTNVVEYSTSSDCLLFERGKGGGIYGQNHNFIGTTYLSPFANTYMQIAPVNDNKYKGNRTCILKVSISSLDSNLDGTTLSKTFTILDDEEAPSASESKPTTVATPTTATSNKPDPPKTPKAILLDADGNEINQDDNSDVPTSFDEGQSVTVSGTTIPNGAVKLYIFSEPQEAEVTADNQGNWTYTIEGLEPGDHRVEAEVTDPATGETSERAEVLAFTVAQAETIEDIGISKNVDAPVKDDGSSLLPIVTVISALVLAGAGGGYWFWKKRSNPTIASKNTTTNTEAQPSSTVSVANSEQDSEVSENLQEKNSDDI